jgi:hypothetical protein
VAQSRFPTLSLAVFSGAVLAGVAQAQGVPLLTQSTVTAAAQAEQAQLCAGGAYPAQTVWGGAGRSVPVSATSGTPKVEQYRMVNGVRTLVATYATLGGNPSCYAENAAYNPEATASCGPFSRGPYRQWLPGDEFDVYPAVYSGDQNQPWIGPAVDTAAQYSCWYDGQCQPFYPTNITIKGIVQNGVRPVIRVSGGASYVTLGQGYAYIDHGVGITWSNIDIDGSQGEAGKALFYLWGANDLTITDSHFYGGEYQSGGVNGVFGTEMQGTLKMLRVELDHNGGWNGPAHNFYDTSSPDVKHKVVWREVWSHDVVYGHTFKSRAPYVTILRSYLQGGVPQPGQDQAEAYLADVPNGGVVDIEETIFAKNAAGQYANGIGFAFAMEGVPDGRALGVTLRNNSFISFADTFDGFHPNFPISYFYPQKDPTAPGFPVKSMDVSQNLFAGYCPTGNPALDNTRGTLALTTALSELDGNFSIVTQKWGGVSPSPVGRTTYAHQASGAKRALTTVGSQD